MFMQRIHADLWNRRSYGALLGVASDDERSERGT